MKQRLLYSLLFVLAAVLMTSCASEVVGRTENSHDEYAIVEIDGKDIFLKAKRDGRGNLVVDDSELTQFKEVVKTSDETGNAKTRSNPDHSSIVTMVDGYGNKVETRTFDGDARLKQVVLRTFTNGTLKVFVYGINGEVKSVPEHLQDRVLTASSTEIASAAMIYAKRKDLDTYRNELSQVQEQNNTVRQNAETPIENQSSERNAGQTEQRKVSTTQPPNTDTGSDPAAPRSVDQVGAKTANKQPEK